MIEILDKKDCCGCNACVQRCPKQCIAMQEDEEGFIYPKVDASLCIECGLCEKVCPVMNQKAPRKPLKVYAAKNNDEKIRMKSSSGGVFTALAEKTISNGGVVFGARFNKTWEVEHGYTETVEGLSAFRG
ncbi:MAG: 4Fe-4S binding protein, partial [Bacteroidaceae bacterium]